MDVADAVVLINDENPSLDKDNTWWNLAPKNSHPPKAGQVFFSMPPGRITNLKEKTAHELCMEIGELLFSKNSNLRPESFGHFYVCCHFGGGSRGDVCKKTVLLNSALEQEDKKWSFLAISKNNSFPDWLFEKGPTEVKLRSLKKDDLFTNIKYSIDNAAHELQTIEQKKNLDDIIDIVEDYITPKNRNSRQHCAIVVGCSCKKSEIEDLYKAFGKKRGTADVFILTNEGVVASTWAGWTGKPLSNECIAHFGRNASARCIGASSRNATKAFRIRSCHLTSSTNLPASMERRMRRSSRSWWTPSTRRIRTASSFATASSGAAIPARN